MSSLPIVFGLCVPVSTARTQPFPEAKLVVQVIGQNQPIDKGLARAMVWHQAEKSKYREVPEKTNESL